MVAFLDSLTIRKMTIQDVDDIYEVEKRSFAVPWTKDSFYYELEQNLFSNYMVAEINGKIVGYCGLWVIMEDAQITNIAVLPEYRGKKIGETLLTFAKQLAFELSAERLSLEVRVSNYIAQSLYKKLGFSPGGIRKNYYTDNSEDALVMWVNLK
ncbi:ribosomal protein S18-alanine N-acetyltransferase [Metabacillus fastidiosus]|uniref:ribosomal protein S18-alanine N-acetyltransferase n=1 Tax=Metabacillus fastidiosus TaxID=1458 RepID=UPI0008261C3B|nr:ribosomal protein S18-alanine N-acetyltransferase [Metabacillus fastidiosus]MED4455875.1 ribosomal protein S18-alanine N-acetyltransferase [Metabacillus fastidiosus]MED4464668.1 ribosomal protein S18-alanine N-acetyltransferase [Metabacillus fastidiosus]